MSGTGTRQLLVDAALRAFCEHGIHHASLLEITRMAGQRNRGAVHYHFGSREGLLAATLEQPSATLGPRTRELLVEALNGPADDVAGVLEALVRPVVELAEDGWRGRCYLRILSEVALEGRDAISPPIAALVAATGGYQALDLLADRLPPMPDDVRQGRFALLVRFVLNSAADRGKHVEAGTAAMPTERYVANLVAMAGALVTAPVAA